MKRTVRWLLAACLSLWVGLVVAQQMEIIQLRSKTVDEVLPALLPLVEPGGTLIIASECSEGFGSSEFREAQRKMVEMGPTKFLDTLKAKSFAEIDEWQTEMQLKPMRIGKVQLYTTGLSEAELRITGIEQIGSVEQAISDSIERHHDPEVAFIPEGPYVIPVFAETH